MTARAVALIIGILDAAVWLLVAGAMILSRSDPATKGLDHVAGVAVTVLFLLTAAPALLLIWYARAPRLALALALGFPAAFAALFVAAVVAFA